MNTKIEMTLAEAMAWIDKAIDQDQKDVAIEILKDLLLQAVESAEKYKELYLNK
jgi:hypothetical protein